MQIGILGTGIVGGTIGTKLVQLGNKVMMGSRTADNNKAALWKTSAGKGASQGTFTDAAEFAEIIFNCTQGMVSISALNLAGKEALKNKILIDLSNPLDFSKGMPPSLTICNTDSLGEQIQREFPDIKVVKTLNTLNCELMVEPKLVNNGDHDIFLSGNDAGAKQKVKELLKTFGWKDQHLIDDITSARGTEMVLPLWVRLMGTFGTAKFQFKVVK
jgi:8-hydroxy-5-deazaflavin:NADPH oxidoreductase